MMSSDDARRYGELVEEHGLSPTHRQVIAWVPRGTKVLELGCSTGFIGRILMSEKGCDVTGVEQDPLAAEEARKRGLTVLEGSLEDTHFLDSIQDRFDVVIASDVLEHLSAPAPVLARFKQWLTPSGQVILAVPNIATWQIRSQLFLRGDFTYQETGILDRTHLHFFTWDTLHRLIEEQSWHIEDTMIDGWEVPGGRTLLFTYPIALMDGLREKDGSPPSWASPLARARFEQGRWMHKIGRAIGPRLARKYPNLCAPHIALLLRDGSQNPS